MRATLGSDLEEYDSVLVHRRWEVSVPALSWWRGFVVSRNRTKPKLELFSPPWIRTDPITAVVLEPQWKWTQQVTGSGSRSAEILLPTAEVPSAWEQPLTVVGFWGVSRPSSTSPWHSHKRLHPYSDAEQVCVALWLGPRHFPLCCR